MTALHVTTTQSPAAPQFAVVGYYNYNRTAVLHAALLREDRAAIRVGQKVPVFEMGLNMLVVGPLTTSQLESTPTMEPEVIGYVNLSSDERKQLSLRLSELDKDTAASGSGFLLFPHAIPSRRQFSCIGFVYDCYDSCNIQLVDISTLPDVYADFMSNLFPSLARERNRIAHGLTGNGPWKILLPGYVFHSLSRSDVDIRRHPFPITSKAQAHF